MHVVQIGKELRQIGLPEWKSVLMRYRLWCVFALVSSPQRMCVNIYHTC